MATDTARVQLELASGRNEITAPFHHTAQRRRNEQFESDDAASVGEPGSTILHIPLAAASPPMPAPVVDPEVAPAQRGWTAWIAFAIAIVSVAFAVWWVMAQRIPDIDPRDVIARNLNDAQTAMADGRYTDPPERSAFHYYSTVLALDPDNHDAIAGIDAIADRHLTNARVLLAQHLVAEAGVALEKARRVRPDHNGLAVLEAQWRAALKRMLAAATTVATPDVELLEKAVVAKTREPAMAAPKLETPAPEVTSEVIAPPSVPDVAAALPEPQPAPITGTNIVAEHAAVVDPEPAPIPEVLVPPPATKPKLIRMVEPQYPQEALLRGIEGWVDVSLQVSAAGDVIAPRVEESNRGRIFNRAALAAVEQWQYEPRSDGSTSERVRVRLEFQRSH